MPDFDNPADPHSDWARTHVHDYVATNGEHPKNGHDWIKGATVLLLTTIGHRSGRARRTPLIYARDGDRYLVVASKGGSDTAPSYRTWSPRVRIRSRAMPACIARKASRCLSVADWYERWPDYDGYNVKPNGHSSRHQ
jgi:deazaflavin-dependent oxidoreductase (nitroreductase family)